MGRLTKYAAESELMNIDITYAGKRYRFNLYEELQIKEASLNHTLKTQSSSYAFLTMLHTHLIKECDELEILKRRAFNKAYVQLKEKVNPTTGRPYSEDLAKSKAEISKDYKQLELAYRQCSHNLRIIEKCVRAFEQRKDLVQSLSANLRKER